MPRSRIARSALTVLMVSVVPAGALAATGDTEPDDSTPVTSDPTTATDAGDGESGPPSASSPAPSEPSGSDAGGDGPGPPVDIEFQVDMMLGLVPEGEMNDYWAQQGEEQQLAIQACMNESGFEYNVDDQSQFVFNDPFADMPPLEYAEQYGFGVWTTMDPETDPYADLGNDYEWPNQEIVDGLSSGEQNAWFEVNNRCSNDAYNNVDNDPYRNPEVQQAMEDFYADIENDPRMRDASTTWVACMEAGGHPYPSEEAMYDDVNGGDDDYTLHNQFYESEAWDPASEDHDRWQQLVDREIEVAVANAGCSPALQEVREQVTSDLRDDLIAVWQTIDWSLPPVTYEGEGDVFVMPGDTLPMGSEPDASATTEAQPGTGDTGAGATTEPAVGLDLGDPPATTTP